MKDDNRISIRNGHDENDDTIASTAAHLIIATYYMAAFRVLGAKKLVRIR